MRHRGFLAVFGGTGTAYAIVAVLAMHIVGRPHSGAGIAIAADRPSLLLLVGLSLIALSFSAWLAWSLSRRIILSFGSLDYRLASFAALCLLVLFNALNGPGALGVMAIATAIGLACLHTGARRSSCMASLLIPTLLYYIL
jgi:TctA family transporter